MVVSGGRRSGRDPLKEKQVGREIDEGEQCGREVCADHADAERQRRDEENSRRCGEVAVVIVLRVSGRNHERRNRRGRSAVSVSGTTNSCSPDLTVSTGHGASRVISSAAPPNSRWPNPG